MISFRRHAIAIASIFLALALGLLLGSQLGGRGGALLGLHGHGSLQHRDKSLTSENGRLNDELNAADAFIAKSEGRLLSGTLADHSVLLVTTPDAARADVDGVTRALTTAGASVSGTIALSNAFIDSSQGDRLRAAVTNMIPAGAQLETNTVDQGSLAGDLLGLAFLVDPGTGQPRATPQERGLILNTLHSGGFLDAGDVQPAQSAVLVTGAGTTAAQNNQGSIVAQLAGALRARGDGTVLAGRSGAADGAGPIAVVRGDQQLESAVTTVDNVDREMGRVTTALALSEQLKGGAGRYGTGAKATSLTVAAMPK